MRKNIKQILFIAVLLFIPLILNADTIDVEFDWESPLTIKNIVAFLDGGTIGILLKDNRGNETSLCFDYRLLSETYGQIFIGAIHPTSENAKLLSHKNKVEKKILSALAVLINAHLDGSRRIIVENQKDKDVDNLVEMIRNYIKKLNSS